MLECIKILLSLSVGLVGALLSFKVVSTLNWDSERYSFYRHFHFILAGLGSVGWSYGWLGIANNSIFILTPMLILLTTILYIYNTTGDKWCKKLERCYNKLKKV